MATSFRFGAASLVPYPPNLNHHALLSPPGVDCYVLEAMLFALAKLRKSDQQPCNTYAESFFSSRRDRVTWAKGFQARKAARKGMPSGEKGMD